MWETIFAGSDMLDRHCEKILSEVGHYAVDASEFVLPQVEVNETLPGDVEPSLHFCQLPFLAVRRPMVRYSACHLICAQATSVPRCRTSIIIVTGCGWPRPAGEDQLRTYSTRFAFVY